MRRKRGRGDGRKAAAGIEAATVDFDGKKLQVTISIGVTSAGLHPIEEENDTQLVSRADGRCTGRKTAAGTASATSGKTTCELPPVRRGKRKARGLLTGPGLFCLFCSRCEMIPAVPWMEGPGPFNPRMQTESRPSGNGSALRPFRRPDRHDVSILTPNLPEVDARFHAEDVPRLQGPVVALVM